MVNADRSLVKRRTTAMKAPQKEIGDQKACQNFHNFFSRRALAAKRAARYLKQPGSSTKTLHTKPLPSLWQAQTCSIGEASPQFDTFLTLPLSQDSAKMLVGVLRPETKHQAKSINRHLFPKISWFARSVHCRPPLQLPFVSLWQRRGMCSSLAAALAEACPLVSRSRRSKFGPLRP